MFPLKGNTKYFSPVISDFYEVFMRREYRNTFFLLFFNFLYLIIYIFIWLMFGEEVDEQVLAYVRHS